VCCRREGSKHARLPARAEWAKVAAVLCVRTSRGSHRVTSAMPLPKIVRCTEPPGCPLRMWLQPRRKSRSSSAAFRAPTRCRSDTDSPGRTSSNAALPATPITGLVWPASDPRISALQEQEQTSIAPESRVEQPKCISRPVRPSATASAPGQAKPSKYPAANPRSATIQSTAPYGHQIQPEFERTDYEHWWPRSQTRC